MREALSVIAGGDGCPIEIAQQTLDMIAAPPPPAQPSAETTPSTTLVSESESSDQLAQAPDYPDEITPDQLAAIKRLANARSESAQPSAPRSEDGDVAARARARELASRMLTDLNKFPETAGEWHWLLTEAILNGAALREGEGGRG